MKQVTVKSASGQVEVKVNASELNPQSAIAARDVAFGVGASATVSDGEKEYRVTGTGSKTKARKV